MGERAAARVALIVLLGAVPLAGQTVRPLIVEYKEKARAKFELVNNSLFPVNVVLEPQSFSVSVDGEVRYRPLDSSIHLKLSAMSFRIPPKQNRFVFYEAQAETLPACFTIYSLFAGLPRQSGLNIQLGLPHTVYLLQAQPLEKSEVRVRLAQFQPKAQQVVIELENTGPSLGRVQEAVVSAGREKRTHGGFPLFPHSVRRLKIPWDTSEPPQKLMLRFAKFAIEEKVVTWQGE